MAGKAKLLFQIILLLPMLACCVLLVSLFPPYRRSRKNPAGQNERGADAMAAFSTPLAEDLLAAKKG